MVLILIALLLAVGYTFLFHLIPLNNWFLFLWIPLSIILGILTVLIYLVTYFRFASRKKPLGKYRHFILRQIVNIAAGYTNIKVYAEGRENIPDDPHFVVYANHKSNLDPLILYLALNRRVSIIGKKSLFQNPIMKNIAATYAAVAMDRENDREALKSLLVAIKQVKDGIPMIIFPEGGIKTRDVEEMVNLRAGAYKLAIKSQGTILPVSIIGSSEISRKKLHQRKNIKVIIHKPIPYEEYKDLNSTKIGLQVEELINETVKKNTVKE